MKSIHAVFPRLFSVLALLAIVTIVADGDRTAFADEPDYLVLDPRGE